MKIFAAGLVLALTSLILPASAADTPAPVPRKAPEFVFTMQDGKQVLLSSTRGKVVAIAFMFTTCPHCQALCPILANIQKDYAAKGVQFIGDVIDEGAKDGLAQFVMLYSKNAFPVGWSLQASALEFLKHDAHYYVPMMAFVDRKGMIVSQHIGNETEFFSNQDKSIRAELDKILAGTINSKPVTSAPKATPAVATKVPTKK
jgi:thiol-disulfide isomerase/thioredoxin